MRAEIGTRLRSTWSQVLTGAPWSSAFRLGSSGLTGARLAAEWSEVHRAAMAWEDWARAAGEGVGLRRRTVSVFRTPHQLPASLEVVSIDVAARIVGEGWPDRLARARERRDVLVAALPDLDDVAGVLRATEAYDEVDLDLLCRVAAWFAAPHPPGLTARQVPVEGLGTKWLRGREALVCRLAGVASLDLARARPPRVHLTYLDPVHLASGARRHDLATVGDADVVAYRPRVVLISENRDTAQLFPPAVGGIAIEGEGRGAGAVAALPWVREAPVLCYWGDLDADGLEILHEFRAAGLAVRSLFMDLAAYERWEPYGVDHDHHGGALRPRAPRELPLLEPGERALYDALCSPGWTRHRRIEQERIPLAEAAAALSDLMALP